MERKGERGFVERFSTFVVDKRKIFFVLYICAVIFCMFSIGWVQVENDVTTYLPEDVETRQGLTAMNENFASFATAKVMVSNITYETAEEIYTMLSGLEGVMMVTFSNSPEYYKDAAALYDLNFTGGNFDPVCLQAIETIREKLEGYDLYIDTLVGYDENSMLREEMLAILLVGVSIVLIVLASTSRAYMEVLVLLLNFAVAALLNMGTNFIFKKISFISDSVAVVLQLALAIDYAIILCHRFSDEHEALPPREAAIAALSKAIPEISASSLTTISGLSALGFMKFSIGMDMAMVLVKAIFLSLLTVFTLLPGLMVLFAPLLDKTRHKKLLPNITLVGKFAVKTRKILPPLFVLSLVGAFYLSSNCPYAYSYTDLRTAKMTERQNAYFKIKETFGTSNMAALLVPVGDYEAEAQLLEELSAMPQVKGTMGLSGMEAMEGYMLTEALTPRELSELLGLDYELVRLLYTAYAAEHNEYGEILSGMEEFRIPLFDMFLYLKDQLEARNISLPSMDGLSPEEMFGLLDMARAQMQSKRYTRMVVYLNLPEESEETFAFLGTIREIIGKYYEGDYYVVGNSTSSRDLAASFATDNLMISLISISFVVLVLLFTFKSAGLSVLLILVIQGSIWINFSIPTLTGTPLYFLGYLIVNALQMGANIDYAIVISSHYQEMKKTMPYKEAIVQALNSSFPTVFTSGTIMAAAGLLIGGMSAQPVVSIMGTCIGRGTIISMILVLFVLPPILVLGDSIIEKTTFQVKTPEPRTRTATGTLRVQGRVRGQVTGVLDAYVDGILHGQLDALVSTDTTLEGGADHD